MGNAFRKVIFSGLLAAPFFVFAQTDSTKNLKELVVKGYDSNVSVVKTPSSVSTLKLKDIQRFDNAGPVVLLNTQAGVRIEERSPGSYRIALRGSSLRSPFNVRNVKFTTTTSQSLMETASPISIRLILTILGRSKF
ncbi:MAG: hypothetical protein IPH28_08415 [Cytophagaceae bacterium]|nr:hypothetical protein [Cytophagaceae bacterium]